MRVFKRATSEGSFRIRWSSIRPYDSDSGPENDLVGSIMYKALTEGNLDDNWVVLYANVFARELQDDERHEAVKQRAITEDHQSKNAKGSRRLLGVRHAIVERLLILQ